jgi:hypothetical protein
MLIDLTEQDAKNLTACIDVVIKKEGLASSALLTQLAAKIGKPFVEQVKEVKVEEAKEEEKSK